MGFLNDHFPRVNERVGTARRTLRQYWANGSPRAWMRLAAFPFIALRHGRPPFFLDVAMTYRCQCRCVHCSATGQAGPGEELSTPEVKALLDEAASMGVLQLIMSGGEPLLRPDIMDIIRHAHKLGMLIRLNSNGLLLTRERARQIKRAGVALVGLSLDSARPEVHDRLRGIPGLFDKVIEAVENLREAGVLCQLQTYVSKETAGEGIREIAALARRLRVFCLFVFFAIASGRWESAFGELLTPEEQREVQGLQDAGLVNVEFATPRTPCCALAGSLIYVSALGNVTLCPFVPYSMGNLHKETFAEIWRRHAPLRSKRYRGVCPMNTLKDREFLKAHAESVAARRCG
jgi:MoaA/NifB/PqqE/SkfB family radical SAM enzyme